MYKMKTSPWAHQLRALDYLIVRNYGALYTDMGTGKTKVAIDLIVNREFQCTLIVTTKKGCDVWENEFSKHCDLTRRKICVFKLSNLSTPDKLLKVRKTFGSAAKNGVKVVYIVNYDSVWRKPFSSYLLKMKIDCVICDESHRIKAPASKCSMYLNWLGKKVPNRFLITGTPSTESPLDVYAQYRFLQPSIFGTNYNKFKDYYENVDVGATLNAGFRILDKKQPYLHLDELKKKMYSCAFYAQSSVELPPQTFIQQDYTPTKKLMSIYEELNKEGVFVEGKDVLETNNALAKATRLQQVLSGYVPMETDNFTRVIEKPIDSTRAEALEDILEGIGRSEPVVIFAKFRYDFGEIEKIVRKLGLRYGELSGIRDDEKDWSKGQFDVLAVHYKSGSESIDLTRARYCIYYSLSNSYGLYRQSIKRTHRPGQTRPVTYYTLVCRIPEITTIDEKCVKALALKQDLADYLLNEEEE